MARRDLDGLVIRNANRGDSRGSIRKKKLCFHGDRAPRDVIRKPSDPTATVIVSHYTVALHSVALRLPGLGVSQENRPTPPEKGPVAPAFSALKEGVALQAAS